MDFFDFIGCLCSPIKKELATLQEFSFGQAIIATTIPRFIQEEALSAEISTISPSLKSLIAPCQSEV